MNLLSEEIETLRREMAALGIRYGFLHPEVQGLSNRLDRLLVRFYALAYPNRSLSQASNP
ncbi:hypothetical protein SD70_08290 [Gordoniibacillus kamchatkensis]|uniref:Aspartyl-phosphate phosphatase Spo0E family protein n=1 Tax=Gordoniibacillus kamchatkensis TaxID=1590651 RepID=A0ABR5AJP7_9BACL|nr:aspartyl-phosphate phosphatase Spo0E family protein [Paenibacillus sp. VKM B-2647]KIL41244.1 hypothetical protein SD70_08290 [Paenibacillus sp. VKM B-2647]